MKFTIDAASFKRAVALVAPVVERRSTVPILSHVLLTAGVGRLTLFCTDMDAQIETSLDAAVEVPGALAAPAAGLAAYLAGAIGAISCDAADGKLALSCASGSVSLTILPAADMPRMQDKPHKTAFSLPAAELRAALASVSYAISGEEVRYYLNGIYMHRHESALRLVAMDGHRMAIKDMPAPARSDGMPGIIVRKKACAILAQLLHDKACPADLAIELGAQQLCVALGDTVLTSRPIDGTFPDYQRIIPSVEATLVFGADRKTLLDAIKGLRNQMPPSHRALALDIERNSLKLSFETPDASGEASIASFAMGDPVRIGFSAKYLIDVLSVLRGKDVAFVFRDYPGGPVEILDPARPEGSHVLMPMMV